MTQPYDKFIGLKAIILALLLDALVVEVAWWGWSAMAAITAPILAAVLARILLLRHRERRAEAALDLLAGPRCYLCGHRGAGAAGDPVEGVWVAWQFCARHRSCAFGPFSLADPQ